MSDLRELFVKYGYPRMTQAEEKLVPAIEAYLNQKIVEELEKYRKSVDKIESIAINTNNDMLDRIKELKRGS